MNFTSLGDAAQQFQLRRNNTDLKSTLNTLSAQLSSGEIADKAKSMSGDTARFSAIDHSLKILETQRQRSSETALTLSTMQRTLDSVDTQRAALAETLNLVTRDSPSVLVDSAAREATERFSSLVNTLNTRIGDRSLFAGTAVDQPAFAPPEDMLADLVTFIGAATTQDDIQTAIDFWFDDPAGGFATMGYLGDTGAKAERRLDEVSSITIDARGDDAAIKDLLKSAAIGAVADALPGITKVTKTGLLFDSGIRLQSAASTMANVQAGLGYAEEEVERFRVLQVAENTALTISRNELANDDPFETASALQAVQLQLETHYAMTARLSRLSLAEYLR